MDFNLNIGDFTSDENVIPLDTHTVYDIVIVGGGPAGLTAAVYCMRKGFKTAIILKTAGGQVAETAGIENYMGYRYINGVELVQKYKEQVTQFGISYEEGVGVRTVVASSPKKVVLDDGREIKSKAIIIATGKSWKKLNVPGEDTYLGKGVAYCSICDGPLYANKNIVIVGGGNSAVEAMIDLCSVVKHITVVQFLETLTADQILLDRLQSCKNIDFLYEHEVVELKGEKNLNTVIARNRKTEEKIEIPVQGAFIEIGLITNSQCVQGIVELNDFDEIVIDAQTQTSVEGIFAAGDVTNVPYKQIIIAAGDGAKAALSACDYVRAN